MLHQLIILDMKCNLCNYEGNFLQMGDRKNARCPNCKSLERHREFAEIYNGDGSILHISPNPGLRIFFEKSQFKYTSSYMESGGYNIEESINKKFDNVIMIHVLEHIEKDTLALKNVFNCLNKNGVLWIQVPFEKTLRSDLGHIRKYTKQGFKMKLSKTGFKLEEINGFFRCQKV